MPTPEELAADIEAEIAPGMAVPGLTELVTQMAGLKSTLDGLELQLKDLQREYDALRKVTIPRVLHGAAITNARFFSGILSLRHKTYARVPKAREAEARRWFIDSDYAHLLTVQPTALRALVTQLVEGGQPVPDFIQMYTEEMAALTVHKGARTE